MTHITKLIILFRLIKDFGLKKIIVTTRGIFIPILAYYFDPKDRDVATQIAEINLIANTIIGIITLVIENFSNYPQPPNSLAVIGYILNLFIGVLVDLIILIKVRGYW